MKKHYAPDYFLDPMHKLSVLVIGAGGTGSHVLTSLARMNATLNALDHPGLHVTVYDDDVVSDANIGRQLFSASDIGRYKADVLIERINRHFSLDWVAEPMRWNADRQYNIIMSCVDNIKTRRDISKAIGKESYNNFRGNYYWMDFGNENDVGQVILGGHNGRVSKGTNKLPNVRQMFPKFLKGKDKKDIPSCSVAESIAKQDLFVNSLLAQLGCNILWKLFRQGYIEHHGAFMNLETLTVKPIKV